jgi:hypothetical protein
MGAPGFLSEDPRGPTLPPSLFTTDPLTIDYNRFRFSQDGEFLPESPSKLGTAPRRRNHRLKLSPVITLNGGFTSADPATPLQVFVFTVRFFGGFEAHMQ